MIKIGDFSKLSQVSVKALRHYDELGLLKPARVDRFTGYRYYSADQLPRLNRILALKDLGFSLEQIGQLLDEELPAAQIRGMLRLKQAELQQRVHEEQARLARVEARLRQIEQEGKMPEHEVVLKKVEPQWVVSARGIASTFNELGPTLDRLFDEAHNYGMAHGARWAGPGITIYHDPEYREQDLDVEAVIPIQETLPGNESSRVYELPGAETMACVVHHGAFATLNQAYTALLRWIEANGYRISGPNREIYLQYERGGDQSRYVTEIQFPVEKAQ